MKITTLIDQLQILAGEHGDDAEIYIVTDCHDYVPVAGFHEPQQKIKDGEVTTEICIY